MTGNDEMFTALQPYGVPNVPFDIALDYRLDPAAKVLDVKTLEVDMRGARQDRAGAGDGRHQRQDRTWPAPRTTAGCARASLTVDDTGLLAKLLPACAKEEGVKPDELVQTALAAIAAFAAQQGAATP